MVRLEGFVSYAGRLDGVSLLLPLLLLPGFACSCHFTSSLLLPAQDTLTQTCGCLRLLPLQELHSGSCSCHSCGSLLLPPLLLYSNLLLPALAALAGASCRCR